MASVLVTASGFANDHLPGGFRDQCLAALVYQARGVITANLTPGTPDLVMQVAFAKGIIRNAVAWQDSAAWLMASDPTVYVLPANTTSDTFQPILLAAMSAQWGLLSHLSTYTG